MKKVLVLLLSVAIMAVAFVGCGAKDVYKAVEATDVVGEEYGLIVGKNHAKKTEILKAMNEVIDEMIENEMISKLSEFHNDYALDTTTLTIADKPLADPDFSSYTSTLKVYTNAEFAPFEYVKGGKVIGVDIDIMNQVGVKLKMKVEFSNVPFESIVAAVQNGVADCGAAGITISDEREEVEFSKPYFSSVQYIICKEDQNYTKISDLKGLKIGVQISTTGDLFCSDEIKKEEGSLYGSGAQVVQLKSGPAAFLGLKSGQVDVVVLDKLPAQVIVSNQ